ncbi:MAG: alkaline phosphatase family protein [Rhodobacteraceae bacterium]|nr:alkaline phosphatase family protein [Paracoccaceae bacterium]
MPQQRKVLVVIVDQLRADCIVGGLATHVDTPNIDALRKDAVTFTQHFSVTNPCGPSRASLFTGRYAMNHRSIRNGTPLAEGIPNLALEARKAGYAPQLFGYTDTGLDPRVRHPNDPALTTEEQVLPGFIESLEMRYQESYPWRAHLKSQGYEVPEYARFYEPVSPDPDRAARPDDPPFYRAEHSDTAFLTDRVLQDLSVRRDQNWFALVTYLRPHPPLVAPPPFNTMYQAAELPKPNRLVSPEEEKAVHPFMAGAIARPRIQSLVKGCGDQLDNTCDADVAMLRALYMGLLTEVDLHIGRIISFLKDSGQYDDTLIVIMADHGEMLGDHYMWGKQTTYDSALRIPLIIRDPAQPRQHGTSVEAFTESVDVTPTILETIGLPVPDGMDGRSLRPYLEGVCPETWREHVFFELDFGEPNEVTEWQEATGSIVQDANLAVLREARFKLVHFNGDLPPLLFDLEDDPSEMCNLAEDPAHAATLLRLTRKMLNHRMRHADSTLTHTRITKQGAVRFAP